MTEDEFVNAIYVQAKDEAHLIELLDAAVRERLRLNVGLIKENSDLRKKLAMPPSEEDYTKRDNPISDNQTHPLDLHTLGLIK